MSNKITYIMVEVEGVEDALAAVSAVENLSNNEQLFTVLETKIVNTDDEDAGDMGPVIYFP